MQKWYLEELWIFKKFSFLSSPSSRHMKKVEFEVVFICQKNSAVEVKSAKIVFLFLQRQRLTFCWRRTQEKRVKWEKYSSNNNLLCWCHWNVVRYLWHLGPVVVFKTPFGLFISIMFLTRVIMGKVRISCWFHCCGSSCCCCRRRCGCCCCSFLLWEMDGNLNISEFLFLIVKLTLECETILASKNNTKMRQFFLHIGTEKRQFFLHIRPEKRPKLATLNLKLLL